MTAKDWSIIKNRTGGNDLEMLYQVYCTKYNGLDKINFIKFLRIWVRMHNFDEIRLAHSIKQKYDREFGGKT